jgi:hypothetical protein
MISTMREVRELHELNIELMDTLLVIGQRFLAYADRYDIHIEGRENLASLIGRAQHILEQIGRPYLRNPILSDASYHHPKQPASDDKETEPWQVTLKSNPY